MVERGTKLVASITLVFSFANIMKMTGTLQKATFFLTLIAAVAALPNGIRSSLNRADSDPEMEKYLKEAIENFREQMKDGIDAIQMPRLDPLELKNLDINVQENLAVLSLRIKKIVIEQLSEFTLENLNADLETFFLKLKLALPEVKSNGTYFMDGKLLKIFPLNGNGSFSINLTKAVIAGEGKLIPEDDTLQMNKLNLDLSWEKLDISLENFLGGGRFADVLQKMLPNVGKNIFDSYKPQILKEINKQLMKALNDVMKLPEVKNIVGGLIPK